MLTEQQLQQLHDLAVQGRIGSDGTVEPTPVKGVTLQVKFDVDNGAPTAEMGDTDLDEVVGEGSAERYMEILQDLIDGGMWRTMGPEKLMQMAMTTLLKEKGEIA